MCGASPTGVTVLSNRFPVTLERGGDAIVSAGINDPNGYADQKTPEQAEELTAATAIPLETLLAHPEQPLPQASGTASGSFRSWPRRAGAPAYRRAWHHFCPPTRQYEKNGSRLFTRGLGNSPFACSTGGGGGDAAQGDLPERGRDRYKLEFVDVVGRRPGQRQIEGCGWPPPAGLETVPRRRSGRPVGNLPANPRLEHRQGHGPGAGGRPGRMAKAAEPVHPVPPAEPGQRPRRVGVLPAQADRRRCQRMKHVLSDRSIFYRPAGRGGEGPGKTAAESSGRCSTSGPSSWPPAPILPAAPSSASGFPGPDGITPPPGWPRPSRLWACRCGDSRPARLPGQRPDRGSFDEMESRQGQQPAWPLLSTPTQPENKAVCYLTWTTEETKRIVQEKPGRRAHVLRAAVGPRYCPSFETKIVRFPDKLPPPALRGADGGTVPSSSSLPAGGGPGPMLHSIPGLTPGL